MSAPAAERKTVLEWDYSPAEAFEEPFQFSTPDHDLIIGDGKVTITLAEARAAVPPAERMSLESLVRMAVQAAEALSHRKVELDGPRILQYENEKLVLQAVQAGVATLTITGVPADVIERDAAGNIIRDTRAERIRGAQKFIEDCLRHGSRDGLLLTVLSSYHYAIADPSNEFVYLYEIRDAFKARYGSDDAAKSALGISSRDWSEFGKLTNVEPVVQGRHRGVHGSRSLRPATVEELGRVREIARRMILSYVNSLAPTGGQA